MMQKIKVAIADDHVLFRQGVRMLLENIEEVDLIFEADNGQELIDQFEEEIPDVVLMDLRMPVMNGVETTRLVKENYPKTKVIVLTMHNEHQFILSLFQKGVNGYLLKNATKEELKDAILSVYENDYHFNDYISKAMMIGLFGSDDDKWKGEDLTSLKDRELDVLKMICAEKTSEEIAKTLFLSIRTIEGYRNKLLEKTGAKNTAGLVLYAVRNKLLSVDLQDY